MTTHRLTIQVDVDQTASFKIDRVATTIIEGPDLVFHDAQQKELCRVRADLVTAHEQL